MYPGWPVSLRHGLAFEPHPVASAVPAEPGTYSGTSRGVLDRSAIRAFPLIMVALLSTCSERAKVTMFSEVVMKTPAHPCTIHVIEANYVVTHLAAPRPSIWVRARPYLAQGLTNARRGS